MLKSGKEYFVSDERISKLKKLGFQWNYDSQSSLTIFWNERFSEITSFKQQWWHCDENQKYAKNQKLGGWARHQRSQYRLLNSDKKSSISDERIAQFEKLGLKWN